MSDQDTLPAHVHPEIALLPWYANGTLSDSDRDQVDRHLSSCATCRAELEDLTLLGEQLITLYAAQPGPSPDTSRRVREDMARESRVRRPQPAGHPSWLDSLNTWLRSLFVPRWAPTLAVMLLLAQIGVIMWISVPVPNPEQVATRALGMQTAKIVVTFQHRATDEQIRGLLQSLHGRVTDGPTADGQYTIEVPAADSSAVQHKLDILRGRTEVVRSAEFTRP